MLLYLVPCNALANGNMVAEDQGLIAVHERERELKLRILLSYWYYKDTDLDALFKKYFTEPYPDVFADSGGFSAETQGVHIDRQDYAAWVRRWQHLFCVYANLDVIGDPAATATNQKWLEDAGLTPLPVFHTGSDWQHLDNLIEQYPYVALGGMVPYMRYPAKIMPWLVQVFKRAQGKTVFHGFGATSWRVVCAFPWYSVDSSSWGAGFRFGQVPVFDEQRGRFIDVRLGNRQECYRAAAVIRRLGFAPEDFADRKRNDRAKICAISALSYMKAEQWLRGRWGEIHIPGRAGAPAVLRAHLADANPARYGEAVSGGAAGPRLHLADTSNGINYGDADRGLKVYGAASGNEGSTDATMGISAIGRNAHLKIYLADARPHSGGEIAAADTGLKVHMATWPPEKQREQVEGQRLALDLANDTGLKLHLTGSPKQGGVNDMAALGTLNE